MPHFWERKKRLKNKKYLWVCAHCDWPHESYSKPHSDRKFSRNYTGLGPFSRAGNPISGWFFWMCDQNNLLTCEELQIDEVKNS